MCGDGGGNDSKLPFRCDHFSIIIFSCALSFLLFFIFDSLQPYGIVGGGGGGDGDGGTDYG